MTLTEKVDDSKSGWEFWVADESLMRTDDNLNDHHLNQPNQLNFNNSFNASTCPTNRAYSITPWTDHHLSNLLHPRSPEGSLTGIGSSSNYKPINLSPAPSPSQSPRKQLLLNEDPSSLPPSASHTTHLQSYKPSHSPSSFNTPAIVSSQPPKNPSLSRPSPNPSDIPYAHAYELYGRHVTRVQPPSVHPRPLNGPYPLISSPPPLIAKKIFQPPAEVCLECMMRDRDMAGVDVLGPGVWSRESDVDFEEAMLAEAAIDDVNPSHDPDRHSSSPYTIPSSTDHDLNQETRSTQNISTSKFNSSSSVDPVLQSHPRSNRKRFTKGQPLTMSALKAWTQMNPPATAHRWRTLQLFLREQRHYLELERQAKRSIENDRTQELTRSHTDSVIHSNSLPKTTDLPFSPTDYHFLRTTPSRAKIGYRASSAALLTKGDFKDEKESNMHQANHNKLPSSTSSQKVSSSSIAPGAQNFRSPRSGKMNINSLSLSTELLNQSDNKLPNSVTHQPLSSSRGPSPTRFSFVSRKSVGIGESMRPFSTLARARRSGTNSVLSLAPSGSLMDMHIGLSHDRHNIGSLPSPHPSIPRNRSMLNFSHSGAIPVEPHYAHKPSLFSLTSSPTPSRFNGNNDAQGVNQKKDKKKFRHTLKGLWSRLGIIRQRSCSIDQIGSPTPLGIIPSRNRGHVGMNSESEPLAPPPPLSSLTRDQQSHRRTRSTLSLPLTNVCRFGPFRSQSISTPNPGLDSTISSPMSHNFIPVSPGSKLTFNGTGTTGHLSATYMNSTHDPHFDSLAEELEMVPSQKPSLSTFRLKTQSASLGTMSLLSEVSAHEATSKKSGRKSSNEFTRSHDGRESVGGRQSDYINDAGVPVVCNDVNGSGEQVSSVGLMTTNQSDGATQSNVNSTLPSSTSAPDKPPSVLTLMSRSSKILSKLPGLKTRRASSGGSLILQPNSHNSTQAANAIPTPVRGRTDNSRSSTSTTPVSTSIPPSDPISNQPNLDPHSSNLQLAPNPDQTDPHPIDHYGYHPHPHQLDRNVDLPPSFEKGRHQVSRSNDLLALRYVSLTRDQDNS